MSGSGCLTGELVPEAGHIVNHERVDGRLRDECLNEHWFTSLNHAQAIIQIWLREYNEERPKKGLSGLTPAAYAKPLAAKSITVSLEL